MRSLKALALLLGTAECLSSAQWRSQSIYQVITDRFARTDGSTTAACNWGSYCSGTWQGIINKLDYIQGMGFTAVWISPVVKNIAGPTKYGDPYHGYWAQDIYSLNPSFGTASDLKALSDALHRRGMYLMVDVVANHMAYNGAPADVKYSTISPFNDVKYYHPYCAIQNGNITSVQNCWTGDTVVSLPDLKTEDATVQSKFSEWIPQLVQNYSIDGLRLDSAMQVNQDFWPSFISASGVYAIGEVFDGNPNSLCTYQNYMPGMLNYATYFWLMRAFQSTTVTMSEMANNLRWLNSTCKDTTLLGTFMENHDNPRFASITNDTGLTQNAMAFTVFNDGIPIIYYGQEQGFSGATDPYNREPLWTSGYNTKAPMYTWISKLNKARTTALARDPTYASAKSNVVYSDSKTLATSKGAFSSPLISVFTNLGAGNSESITIISKVTGLTSGMKFTDLLSCETFTTDSTGNLIVTIKDGAPRALYLSSAIKSVDPCGSANGGSTTSSSTSKAATSSTSISVASTSVSSTVRVASSTTSIPTSSSTEVKTSSSQSSTPSVIASPTSTSSVVKTSSSSSTTSAVAAASASASTVSCPASNSTIFTSNGKSFLIECGIDHAGGDLSMVSVSNLKQCIDACATTSGCVDVSLSGVACYMKSKVGNAVYNAVQGARLVSAPISSTSQAPSATTSACTVASTVAVSFNHKVETEWLESVKMTGSLSQLGNWNGSLGASLSATFYTTANPVWNTTLQLAAGTYFEYKFVTIDSKGVVTWEADPNRNYTVPKTCEGTAVLNSTWQTW